MPDSLRERLQDPRLTDVLGVLTAVLAVTILVIVAVYVPGLAGRTAEIRRTADLAACRSQAAAEVTEARTRFDVARADRDTVATHLTAATNEGLAAAVAGDTAALDRLLDLVPSIRQDLIDAELLVVAATDELREASDLYRVRVIESREDPDRFLRECRTG